MAVYPSTSCFEFLDRFPDETACFRHMLEIRFGPAIACPRCGTGQRLSATSRQRQLYCWRCSLVVSVTAGTLAGHSRIGLWDWFYLMLLVANRTTGMPIDAVARQLGISRLAAYRMLCLIRMHIDKLQQADRGLVGGPGIVVEIDETWLPGVIPDDPLASSGAIVFGIYSQGGIHTQLIADRRAATLMTIIRDMVEPGSIIVTDGHRSYNALRAHGFEHIALNHRRGEWARAGYSMARIESYWTSLKYFLRSHNRTIARNTLPLYLAENAFRHNRRKRGENMFEALIARFPAIDRALLPKGALPLGRVRPGRHEALALDEG